MLSICSTVDLPSTCLSFYSIFVPRMPPTSSSLNSPYMAYTSRPFWDLGSFFLSSPTPKHTEGLQKLGFRTHFLADDATVRHCFFRVGFFKEWGNICSEATLLLPAFGLCVNVLHRTKFREEVSKMRELQGISRKLSLTVNLYDGYVADFHYFKIRV
jgi:hypothetical protein